jgi:hypothetical protein
MSTPKKRSPDHIREAVRPAGFVILGEAAEAAAISQPVLLKYVRRGRVRSFKIGRCHLVCLADAQALTAEVAENRAELLTRTKGRKPRHRSGGSGGMSPGDRRPPRHGGGDQREAGGPGGGVVSRGLHGKVLSGDPPVAISSGWSRYEWDPDTGIGTFVYPDGGRTAVMQRRYYTQPHLRFVEPWRREERGE